MRIFLCLSLLISLDAWSATCKKLQECVEVADQLTGKKTIYDKKILPFTYELNRPLEMNKDNVEKTLSEALNIFGLARIPTQLPETSKLIEARELRFHSDLPSYEASRKKLPNIPDDHNPVLVTYRGVKGADMEVIAEKVRPLLSRYGRTVPMRDGSLVVVDLGSHAKKILQLVQKQDYPLTNEEKAAMALEKKRAHELEMARLKSGEMHEIGPKAKPHKH